MNRAEIKNPPAIASGLDWFGGAVKTGDWTAIDSQCVQHVTDFSELPGVWRGYALWAEALGKQGKADEGEQMRATGVSLLINEAVDHFQNESKERAADSWKQPVCSTRTRCFWPITRNIEKS